MYTRIVTHVSSFNSQCNWPGWCAGITTLALMSLPFLAQAEVLIGPNVPSPQVADSSVPQSTVTFRSTAIPGTDVANNEYQFSVEEGGNTVVAPTAFSSKATFLWEISDFTPGDYTIKVVARLQDNNAITDVGVLPFQLRSLDGVPVDPDTFIDFLESFAPENDATAAAYYNTIDPQGKKTTQVDWLVEVGFLDNAADFSEGANGDDAVTGKAGTTRVIYTNPTDFGFTRRQFVRTDPVTGNFYAYTENYPTIDDADSRVRIMATVAMEYAPAADGSNPRKKFTTFYAFGPDGSRVGSADLDGRGSGPDNRKFVPGVCTTCHGGAPQDVVDGTYPSKGNTGARFLPFDVEVFEFVSSNPAINKADQEIKLREMNRQVRNTIKQQGRKFDEVAGFSRHDAIVEQINGWYGGPGLPSPTFIEGFVSEGWQPPHVPADQVLLAAEVYEKVIGPACRFCHTTRETSLDLATYAGFAVFKDAHEELVFGVEGELDDDEYFRPGDDQAVMPLSKLTYERFWRDTDHVNKLRELLDGITED